MGHQFLIRVYGLLINDKNEVLLSDEKYRGKNFTKFPGGGLEYGEGMIQCLEREFMEEAGIKVQVGELLYLTDFFEESSFDKGNQVISVYYFVTTDEIDKIQTTTKINDFKTDHHHEESFRWKHLSELSLDDVTFDTEKAAIMTLRERGFN